MNDLDKFKQLRKLMRKNASVFSSLNNKYWFLSWLRENMHIYNEFERYALELSKKGKRKRYSSKAIVERIRWDSQFEEDDSSFKISNNCTSYLSRLVMLRNKRLDGMFSIRN